MKHFYFLCIGLLFSCLVQGSELIPSFAALKNTLREISIGLDALIPSKPTGKYTQGFRLPKLTQEQEEAGVLKNAYYDYSIIGEPARKLHREGNTTDKNFLKDFFFKTIFQYYVYELLNYDSTYNYMQFQTLAIKLARDQNKFNALNVKLDNKLIVPPYTINFAYIESIAHALAKIKENGLLQKLGIAYQRNKIIIEKLTHRANFPSFNQAQQKKINQTWGAIAGICDALQTMIFNFMKDGFTQYLKNLSEAKDASSLMSAGDFLSAFSPEWLNAPYYKAIIDKLDELVKPLESVNIVFYDGTSKDIDIAGYP